MSMYSVAPQITILRTVHTKKLSSNELYKRTGLDKSTYTANRKDLQYLDLIEEEPDPKSRQKQFYTLSELGKSVTELIEEAYLFRDKYIELLSGINEKLWFLKEIRDNPLLLTLKPRHLEQEEKNRRNKLQYQLQRLGWTKEEIVYNQECLRNLIDFKHVCDVNFLFILMFRFTIIKWKFLSTGKSKKKDNEKEDLIKEILFELLKDKMLKMLDFEKYGDLATYEFTGYGYMTLFDEKTYHQIKNRINGGIFNLLYDMMKIFVYPLPFVLKDEIENVTKSYFSLISPLFLGETKESVKEIFDEFNEDIQEEKRNLLKLQTTQNLAKTKSKDKSLAREINTFDYFMTDKETYDYLKFKIRTMELFQKLAKI